MTKPNPSPFTDIHETIGNGDGMVTIGDYSRQDFITIAVGGTTAGHYGIGCVALTRREAIKVIRALQKAVLSC